MKRTIAALMTALMLLTFLPLASSSAQSAKSVSFAFSGSVRTVSATSLRITWSGFADGVYIVYRSTDLKNWNPVWYTYGTSFTDTSLRAGTRYFYKLQCVTQDVTYTQTNWWAGVPMGTTRITSLTIPASRRIKIVWSRTAGAGGYLVQMATGTNRNYRTVRIVRGNSAVFSGVRTRLTLYFRVIPYKRIYGTTYTGNYANYYRVWLAR